MCIASVKTKFRRNLFRREHTFVLSSGTQTFPAIQTSDSWVTTCQNCASAARASIKFPFGRKLVFSFPWLAKWSNLSRRGFARVFAILTQNCTQPKQRFSALLLLSTQGRLVWRSRFLISAYQSSRVATGTKVSHGRGKSESARSTPVRR